MGPVLWPNKRLGDDEYDASTFLSNSGLARSVIEFPKSGANYNQKDD